MDISQSELEQLEALKAIWQRYGKAIVTGIFILAFCLGSWQYYRYHSSIRVEQAYQAYRTLLNAVSNKQDAVIHTEAKNLVQNFSDTLYGQLGALMLAKIAVEKNNLEEAATHLNWVIKTGQKGPLVHIARVRLAKVLSAKQDFKAALAILEANPESYVTLYEEQKGDIYVALHEIAQARTAYKKALQEAPPGIALPWVQMKLDELGPEEEIKEPS